MIVAFALFFPLHIARSDFQERITNRRYVSHILYEERIGRPSLTLIMTHPRHWAFKSDSHQMYYACPDYAVCLKVLKKLDQHLRSGHNIRLTLDGSQIVKLQYLKSD